MSACEVATDADTARLRIGPLSSLLHEAERPYRRELLSGYGGQQQQLCHAVAELRVNRRRTMV